MALGGIGRMLGGLGVSEESTVEGGQDSTEAILGILKALLGEGQPA